MCSAMDGIALLIAESKGQWLGLLTIRSHGRNGVSLEFLPNGRAHRNAETCISYKEATP